MLEYNLVHIVTAPMFIFAIFKLMRTFFTGEVYNKKMESVSYASYFLVTIALVFVTRVPLIVMIVNVFSILLISMNYVATPMKRVLRSLFVYSIGLIIELLVSLSITLYEIPIFEDSQFNSSIGLLLVRTIIMIVAYLIHKYALVSQKEYPLPKLYYFCILMISFGTLYLFIVSLDTGELSIGRVALSAVILIVVNVTLMLIDEKIYQSIILSAEQKILMKQNDAYRNQAELSSEAASAIRSLKHDMKNHLSVLNELYKQNNQTEFKNYITQIGGNLSNAKLSNSNNFIFDSIINFQLQRLLGEDVALQVDVVLEPTINILAYDLTVILGNLLENAVDAVLQADEKKLVISVTQSKGNIIILIDNTYGTPLRKLNDKLQTTKTAKGEHGLGLVNVERSLKNYDGELRISHTERVFSVSVIIPYQE